MRIAILVIALFILITLRGTLYIVNEPEQVSSRSSGSRLEIIPDAGHAASEPGIRSALVEATDRFADLLA